MSITCDSEVRSDAAIAISNQADTELHRVCTEFHREDFMVRCALLHQQPARSAIIYLCETLCKLCATLCPLDCLLSLITTTSSP